MFFFVLDVLQTQDWGFSLGFHFGGPNGLMQRTSMIPWKDTPWKINGWNLQITHLERKMIFQTSMIMFHVNFQGCTQIF